MITEQHFWREIPTVSESKSACKVLLIAVAILCLQTVMCDVAYAGSYYYDYIDVDMKILPNSDMQITETQKLVFTSGTFHFAERWIPTDKLDYIDNVGVWEGNERYPRNQGLAYWVRQRKQTGISPGGDRRAFATQKGGGNFWIGWWFPASRNRTRTFMVKYTVHGGVRMSDKTDQMKLYWEPIFKDRSVPVMSSKVVVHLPEPVPRYVLGMATAVVSLQSEIIGVSAQSEIIDDKTIEFSTGRVPAKKALPITIMLPHGIVESQPPTWQKGSDEDERSLSGWLFLLFLCVAGSYWLAISRPGSAGLQGTPPGGGGSSGGAGSGGGAGGGGGGGAG